MVSFLLIALWTPVLPPSVQFEAQTFRSEPGALLLSQDVRLRWPDGILEAESLRWGGLSSCSPKAWSVTQGQLKLGLYHLEVDSGTYCPTNGAFLLRDAMIRTSRGQLSAQMVEGRYTRSPSDIIHLKDGWFTGCTCPSPPWRVTFQNAELQNSCVSSQWPTFEIAQLPVFTVPHLNTDWNAPYSGPLLPRIGRSQSQGWRTEFPFRWAWSEQNDLTFSLGYRGSEASGDATARWVDPVFGPQAMGIRATGSDLNTQGIILTEGTWGRIHVESDWANTPSARHDNATDWRPLRAEWAQNYGGWSWGHRTIALGIDAGLGQNIASGETPFAPRGWVYWAPELAPWHLILQSGLARRPTHDIGHPFVESLENRVGIERSDFMGPLRLSYGVDGWYGRTVGIDEPAQRGRISAYIETDMTWQRRSIAGTHALGFGLDLRMEKVHGEAMDAEPIVWRRSTTRHSLGILHTQTWVTALNDGEVSVRQGVDPDSNDLDPVEITADGRFDSWWISAWALGTYTQGASLDVGDDALGFGLLVLHQKAHGDDEPLRWNWTSRHYEDGPRAYGFGLGPRFRLRIGPFGVNTWALLGHRNVDLYGHGGHLAYSGQCDCWFSSVHWNHDVQTQWSEVVFRIGLGSTTW